jgi:hypothetical protein
LEFLLDEILSQFEAIRACRVIDERLETLTTAPALPSLPSLRIAKRLRRPVGIA